MASMSALTSVFMPSLWIQVSGLGRGVQVPVHHSTNGPRHCQPSGHSQILITEHKKARDSYQKSGTKVLAIYNFCHEQKMFFVFFDKIHNSVFSSKK